MRHLVPIQSMYRLIYNYFTLLGTYNEAWVKLLNDRNTVSHSYNIYVIYCLEL